MGIICILEQKIEGEHTTHSFYMLPTEEVKTLCDIHKIALSVVRV